MLGTVLFTAALLAGLGPELREALRSSRERISLLANGLLIGVNWGVFIWAVGAARCRALTRTGASQESLQLALDGAVEHPLLGAASLEGVARASAGGVRA